MLITAKQKFVRTSPRKLRLMADGVRSLKSPQLAIIYLEQVPQRAAGVLSKVIKTAIANATNNLKLEGDRLKLHEIQIGEGPTYKRGQPVSRGRFHKIEKKTSHITVVLESTTQEKALNVKKGEQRKSNKK
ncbi:MAG: 50S ribosomal protein L22 [Candidatus Blackburnbacteria bacterium RIFCSPHIGHO2_01_FULL_43_15b]|uniref:Large ribosomal subunit protein uL22 n=1 Tax=Candidatus Blackburnbacteria bacterium RIFCSPHIGHO2_01_FULL_43_15b TaxID=1797513 RepID=A0A1G1UZ21_9BACT|nr:MAG: 50S ribosomal protein L22 [Candidatus Blackburnbacteria bacterium RIFCSPHIGHO2_01_FULL_43_15b]